MTEDIDDLQRECGRQDLSPRDLFILGNILDRKKNYMSNDQLRRQQQIEQDARRKINRVMGYQYRTNGE